MPLNKMSVSVTIPIISDSHGYGRRAEIILEKLGHIGENPDELIFLGDGTRELLERIPENLRVYAVKGNCDGYLDIYDDDGNCVPDERVEMIGGKRVLMMHGHEYSVKGGTAWAVARAVKVNADLLLFGHTHIPVYTTLPEGSVVEGATLERPLHIFNPGALAEGSFGLLTIRDGKILLSHGRV